MRVSSATRPSSRGTLRSARTRTLLPATSASRTDRGLRTHWGADRRADLLGNVDEPAAVAPLVVVPADDLDHRPVRHRREPVDDQRVWVADDVGRDDRVVRVLHDPGPVLLARRRAEGVVYGLCGDLAAEDADEVGDAAVGHRNAHRHAVDSPL